MTSIRKTKKRLKMEIADAEQRIAMIQNEPCTLPRLLLVDALKEWIHLLKQELQQFRRKKRGYRNLSQHIAIYDK